MYLESKINAEEKINEEINRRIQNISNFIILKKYHTDIETIYKVHFKLVLTYDAKSNTYEIFWILWNS
jgi:uncharacterized protein with von Willebrand factor type A (vWA) domain